jgi:NTE family protein
MSLSSPRQPRGEENPRCAFVLSGGGSLGAVQVGMLRALLEEGCCPDFVIGTSVGAINAAWVAGKPDQDGIRELADIWLSLRRGDVFPLSPMLGARGLLGRSNHFIANDNLRSMLERHIAYERLEDAKVPVHVVATDLKSGQAAVLSSGPAVPALLASCAIPGVFPPVSIGRREYVDGGVAKHTPVTGAIEMGARCIYVLPVGYPWLYREPTNALGMALHALARIIEQKLDAEIAANRDLAEIHVLPTLDLADVSPADFSHTRQLIEWGYKAARRYIAGAAGVRGGAAAGRDRPPRARGQKLKRALHLAPSGIRAA